MTTNTHDRGALFGYDGQTMWIEQTLDTAPAAEAEPWDGKCEACGYGLAGDRRPYCSHCARKLAPMGETLSGRVGFA